MQRQILPFGFGLLLLGFCVYALHLGHLSVVVDVVWASAISLSAYFVATAIRCQR